MNLEFICTHILSHCKLPWLKTVHVPHSVGVTIWVTRYNSYGLTYLSRSVSRQGLLSPTGLTGAGSFPDPDMLLISTGRLCSTSWGPPHGMKESPQDVLITCVQIIMWEEQQSPATAQHSRPHSPYQDGVINPVQYSPTVALSFLQRSRSENLLEM